MTRLPGVFSIFSAAGEIRVYRCRGDLATLKGEYVRDCGHGRYLVMTARGEVEAFEGAYRSDHTIPIRRNEP